MFKKHKQKMGTQVDLVAVSDEGSINNPTPKQRQMTTWIEHGSKLGASLITEGRRVKLKGDDDTWWEIAKVYSTMPISEVENRGWDNNNYDKHEGLGL